VYLQYQQCWRYLLSTVSTISSILFVAFDSRMLSIKRHVMIWWSSGNERQPVRRMSVIKATKGDNRCRFCYRLPFWQHISRYNKTSCITCQSRAAILAVRPLYTGMVAVYCLVVSSCNSTTYDFSFILCAFGTVVAILLYSSRLFFDNWSVGRSATVSTNEMVVSQRTAFRSATN